MAQPDRKHWSTKSTVKRDDLKDALESAFDWIAANRVRAAWSAGGAAAAVLLVSLFLYARRAREDAAWNKLGMAESYALSGRPQEAGPLLSQLYAEGGGPAVDTLAHLLDGDIHYARGEYDQALPAYEAGIQESPENLRPFAQADKVLALEAAGRLDQCVAAAQAFLDAHGDNMLAPHVSASMARCQQAEGQAEAAHATLEKITLQYPNTPWAAWAGVKLGKPK